MSDAVAVRATATQLADRQQPTVTPLTVAVGAEITGVDLGRLDDETVELVTGALYRHGVVFVPDQHLDQDQQIDLAARVGNVVRPINPGPSVGNDVIRAFASNEGGKAPAWHADVTWMASPPARQVFSVVTLPEVGGDTLWASTERAYESLSPAFRRWLDAQVGIHTEARLGSSHAEPVGATGYGAHAGPARGPFEHPVVHVHPETGRRSLYVNPMYTSRIKGLTPAESDTILDLLTEHVTRPEHVVRYRWSVGTVAIWDNTTTWHYAVDDYGDATRVVHRVSVAGPPLVPVPDDGPAVGSVADLARTTGSTAP